LATVQPEAATVTPAMATANARRLNRGRVVYGLMILPG
jgi:hypothetical protein